MQNGRRFRALLSCPSWRSVLPKTKSPSFCLSWGSLTISRGFHLCARLLSVTVQIAIVHLRLLFLEDCYRLWCVCGSERAQLYTLYQRRGSVNCYPPVARRHRHFAAISTPISCIAIAGNVATGDLSLSEGGGRRVTRSSCTRYVAAGEPMRPPCVKKARAGGGAHMWRSAVRCRAKIRRWRQGDAAPPTYISSSISSAHHAIVLSCLRNALTAAKGYVIASLSLRRFRFSTFHCVCFYVFVRTGPYLHIWLWEHFPDETFIDAQ